MTAPILEVKNLSVGYNSRLVVKDTNFVANTGSLLVVLGANGSGKTTILKTCLGLIPSMSGTAYLNGKPVSALRLAERAKLAAWVPQKASSVWGFEVKDIVAHGRYASKGAFSKYDNDDEMAINKAIETMDIKHLTNRTFSSLSGGEARRVMIARALAQATPLIVLDEPIANLDPGRQMELMEMLKNFAQNGKAIIISMHDVNLAKRFADMALLVKQDCSSIFGTPDSILSLDRIENAYDTSFVHGVHEVYGNFVLPLARKKGHNE